MGVTYKARDTRLDCLVALKVINSACLNSEVARERFRREARAAAKLRHANVASVLYFGGDDEEDYFYAMEFVEGETVDARIRHNGPIEGRVALQISIQVASALAAAQRHGLVHRDIKPANLMLLKEGDECVVKVIDFGLAKCISPTDEQSLTVVDAFVGTPLFSSPEQLRGDAVDTRSDIYSLGVTLWYMLTGDVPFGGTLPQLIAKHVYEPPPLHELATFPQPVVGLLRQMLAKDPAFRPQTPALLKTELQYCLSALELISAARTTKSAVPQIASPAAPSRGGRRFLAVVWFVSAVVLAAASVYTARHVFSGRPIGPVPETDDVQRPPVRQQTPADLVSHDVTPLPERKKPAVEGTPFASTFQSPNPSASTSQPPEPAALYSEVVQLWGSESGPRDEAKAFAILQRLEPTNFPPALNHLGLCYAQGRGTQRNDERAFDFFARAAELGDVNAKGNLGVLYWNGGRGVTANPARALDLLKEAAEGGDENWMFAYAQSLHDPGAGPHRDKIAAVRWFRRAAEKGHQAAAEWLKAHGF